MLIFTRNDFPNIFKKYAVSLIYWVIFIFINLNCASTPKSSPFKISQDKFRESVHNLIIIPLKIPAEIDIPNSGIENFEITLEIILEKAGFKIFSTQKWRNIYNKLVIDSGGLYDSITGKIDKMKAEFIFNATLAEVRKEFQFDAILYPSIFITNADWYGGVATWDGISENVMTNEEIFLESLLFSWFGHRSYRGTVRALSLQISILSPSYNGKPYYIKTSGIQILTKLKNFSFYAVPSEILLTDMNKNKNSILTALSSLIISYSFHDKK